MNDLLSNKLLLLLNQKIQEANQSSLMSLEMEDYQKSLEALQTKLSEKEKELQDSLEEVSRVDKRADDFKTQIGERNQTNLVVQLTIRRVKTNRVETPKMYFVTIIEFHTPPALPATRLRNYISYFYVCSN